MKIRLALLALSFCMAAVSSARADEYQANWPQWRGPNMDGVAPLSKAPVTWSENEGLAWKVELPGRGNSTPIIWGDKVFLLTAVPTDKPVTRTEPEKPSSHNAVSYVPKVYEFVTLCIDAKTGKTLWNRVGREQQPHEGTHQKGSYASPSPVTDGQHLYAYFGTYGLYCYDMDGNLKWKKDLGKFNTRLGFGEGSSPVLHENKIIINADYENESFMVALDKNTGEQLWRKDRVEKTAWATPVVATHDGKAQVIVSATPFVRAYDVETGNEIWSCGGQTLNAIPTTIVHGDLVIATSGFRGNTLKAIKLGHRGDLSESNEAVVWKLDKFTPYVPTPVLYENTLYLFVDRGILSAYEAKTGKPIYEQQRLPVSASYTASPIAADGKLYFASENGDVVVMKAGPQLEHLSTNKMDDVFYASPAAAGDRLFLRGTQKLYCIEAK